MYQSFEAKLARNRRKSERFADDINRIAGSFPFFVFNLTFFIVWIAGNSGLIPGFPVIDPFPYILLTMLVSLEAIFLSIFVLISQNRQASIASIREEIHLQINQIAEREITKVLKLVYDLHRAKFPQATEDPELKRMLRYTDTTKIEQNIEKELTPQPLAIQELLEKTESFIKKPFFLARDRANNSKKHS